MSDLENIFQKRLEQLGLKKQVDASLIVEEAQAKLREIFGDDVEKNLKVISFNKGTLKIAARTSAWATECQASTSQKFSANISRVIYEDYSSLNDDLLS